MYILVNNLDFKFKLLLPLYLLLVLRRPQLPVLVLHPLLLYLHRRQRVLQLRDLRLLPLRVPVGEGLLIRRGP